MIQKLFPLVFILAAAALFFVYINPTYSGPVKDAEAQLQGKKNALAAAQAFKEKQKRVDEQRAQISDAEVKRLETFLPDGVDNIRLIMDVNHAADVSGVQLSGFDVRESNSTVAAKPTVITAATAVAQTSKPDSGSPTAALPLQSVNPVDSIDLSVSASGTYAAFRTFLNATEHSLRPLDLMSMSLQSTDKGVYSYSLAYRIYWLQ